MKRKLVKAGKIRTGLTFHGLRKSLAKKAADLGFSENDIAGALGNASAASARPYTNRGSAGEGRAAGVQGAGEEAVTWRRLWRRHSKPAKAAVKAIA